MPTQARQTNKYLGAYDQPVLRDPMVWVLIGLVMLCFVALMFPAEGTRQQTAMPLWLDSLLGGLVVGAIVGYPAALVRRMIRALRRRRSGPELKDAFQPVQNVPPIRAEKDPEQLNRESVERTPTRPFPPAAPASHESSSAGDLVSDLSILSEARELLPFPIARTARSLQISRDPIEQYTLLLELAESISITVAATAASWLNQNEPDNPHLQGLYQALPRGISQGTWNSVIPSAAKAMSESAYAIPGYCQGVGKSKETPDLVNVLRPVVEERNRWAHGARPTSKGDAAGRVGDLLVHLDAALSKVRFLTESPWVLIRDTTFDRRRRIFIANAGLAMSDHPEFARETIRTAIPLAEDTIYVETKELFIDLTPLIVYKYCAHCRQPEMFYADRLNGRRAVLKSFARGHQTFDEGIFEEIQQIINRPAS